MTWYVLEKWVFLIANTAFIYSYYHIFRLFLGVKPGKKSRDVLCYTGFYMANSLTYLCHAHPMANLTVFLLCTLFCVLWCHGKTMAKKIRVWLLAAGYGLLLEMLSGYLVAVVFQGRLSELLGQGKYAVIVIIMSKVLLLFSSFAASALASVFEDRFIGGERSPHYWGMLMLVPACSMLLIICIFLDDTSDVNRLKLGNWILFLCTVLVFVLNMGVYYLIGRLCREYDRKADEEEQRQLLRMYQENMEIEARYVEEMRIYRHDMKNILFHLQVCLNQGQLERAKELVAKEVETVHQYMGGVRSGNQDLDSLVNYKISVAVSKGISMEVHIRLLEPLKIELRDMLKLFGNLFDNAIEAVERLPEERRLSKPSVEFWIESSRGTCYIRGRNDFDGVLEKRWGRLLTVKEEKKSHGHGMISIERIVNRYRGNLNYESENVIFEIELTLFYPDEEAEPGDTGEGER